MVSVLEVGDCLVELFGFLLKLCMLGLDATFVFADVGLDGVGELVY
jgi:hypothetical protein